MFFKNQTNIKDGDIVYLCDYIPQNRSHTCYDVRSKELVLEFKKGNPLVIESIYEILVKQLGDKIALAAVPSSKVDCNGQSPSHILIRKLINAKGIVNNFIDASNCLYRFKDASQAHLTDGMRDKETVLESLELHDPEVIKGKDVLVFDDITTSGASFKAATDLLRKAGANRVVCLAIGRTICAESLKYGFIFNLDMTLFDTSSLQFYCDAGKLENTGKIDAVQEPYGGIKELFQRIRRLSGYDICIISPFPLIYSKTFAYKLGVPEDHIVEFKSTVDYRQQLNPYFKSKQIMKIYEPCITVFGSRPEYLQPAKELGMTTVCAGWGTNIECNFADYLYKTPQAVCTDLENIISRAYSMRLVFEKEY